MRVVALISGGKDSCYNMMQCIQQGHVIVALANLKPRDGADELDSYMYQTVGHNAIDLYAQAMDLPLYRGTIQGSSVDQGKMYTENQQDEVEDLYKLLKNIKDDIAFDAVSVGAICQTIKESEWNMCVPDWDYLHWLICGDGTKLNCSVK
ncbi:diphthine--ammonia ligase [Desmophyllum pertusum]|uniref:Diphthine--ammonia ligase n=1 Tax=Desmophyllum pertusum TaxID=174260 RepID=A0A9X0CRV5_9CNID|nr:diphthine--ammonia ligase [Desmophyllum pertusum]